MRFLDDMTNYTAQNGKRPDTPAARVIASGTTNDDGPPIFIHLHDDADPSRRPAMREPALATQEDDVLSRLQNLEIQMAQIISGATGESDFGGQGQLEGGDPDQTAFTTGSGGDPDDGHDLLSQIATSHAMANNDALPDDPQSINAKNSAYWQGKGGTTTGMSSSLPPSSRKAESGGYMPNATGSINTNRRLSTTAKVAEAQGRTWGTSDRAAMQRANFWRDQRLATNKAIGKIQQTLQTRWER